MSMRHYYRNYADSHDIDCFFRIGEKAYHFASNGQPIPEFITRKENIEIQDAVYELLKNEKEYGDVVIHVNTVYSLMAKEFERIDVALNERFEERGLYEMIEEYASSFVEMARLGFISMDLDEEGLFHIIAVPSDRNVPDEIFALLPIATEEDVRIARENDAERRVYR